MTDILSKARRDYRRHIVKGGFQTSITFTNPSTSQVATIQGLAMKHHFTVDNEGTAVSSMNAHITVSEDELTEAPYVVRNATTNELAIKGHIIEYIDSTGVSKSYKISETYPDETLGIIYILLQYYDA